MFCVPPNTWWMTYSFKLLQGIKNEDKHSKVWLTLQLNLHWSSESEEQGADIKISGKQVLDSVSHRLFRRYYDRKLILFL